MKASLYQIRISPKKVNVVAKLVRGKKAADAVAMLKFVPKRAAPILAKLIGSAMANAETNFKATKSDLVVSKVLVNEGVAMRRGTPASRGRWSPMKKRGSHIHVEVSAVQSTATPKQSAKKEQAAQPTEPTEK